MVNMMFGGMEVPKLPKKRKGMSFGQWFDKNLEGMAKMMCAFYNVARDERWLAPEYLESFFITKTLMLVEKFFDEKRAQLTQEISDASEENETKEVEELLEAKMRFDILRKSFSVTFDPMIAAWRHSMEQEIKEQADIHKQYREQLKSGVKSCPLETKEAHCE